MATSQKKFRAIVFQILYSWELSKKSGVEELLSLLDYFLVPRKTLYQAVERAESVSLLFSELDPLLTQFCKGYDFQKISPVERSALRLALYEMRFEGGLPPKVALSEGVRLARLFASPEGGAFVNAILDAIFNAESFSCPSKSVSSAVNR